MSRVVLCFAVAACGYPQPQRVGDGGADGPRDARADARADTALDAIDGATGPACSVVLTCTAPATGTQSVCGQLYDLATSAPFTAISPTGAACGNTTSGPCSLQLAAYDAVTYFQAPTTTAPLAIGSTYLDDCGRFQLHDIAVPSGPYLVITVDDRNAAGPAGTTNEVAIMVPKAANTTDNGVEHWIASQATTDAWGTSGGPTTANGTFVGIFRAHVATSTDLFTNQGGVTMTKNGTAIATATYFDPTSTSRTTIDTSATSTGVSGSGVLASASVTDGLGYAGSGGITDTANCRWEPHFADVLPDAVVVQVFRKIAVLGRTCSE